MLNAESAPRRMAAPSPTRESGRSRRWPRRGDGDSGDRRPWRVEGERPERAPSGTGDKPRRSQPSFWAVLAAMFLVNWLLSAWLLAPASRTEVCYTLFCDQVEAGKVAEIT